MYVRACVRARVWYVSCSRDRERSSATGILQRERERARRKDFFVFFISFVSCLVLSSFLRTLPLIKM